MKTLLLTILLLTCYFSQLSAQRYYGQYNFNVSGSYFPNGFGASVGIEKSLGYTYSSIRGEFSFMNDKLNIWRIADLKCNVHSYALSMAYSYSLKRDMYHAFYFNPSGGLLLGLENFKDNLPDGVLKKRNNQFLFGAFIALQAEIVLSRNVSVFIEPTAIYRVRTSLEALTFRANFGLKFYLPR